MHRTKGRMLLRPPVLALGDLLLAVAIIYVSFLLRIYLPVPLTSSLLPGDRLSFFFQNWFPVAVSQVAVLYFFSFYDPPRPRARVEIVRRLVTTSLVQGLVLMGFYFLSGLEFPRSVLVLYIPLNWTALSAWRCFVQGLHRPEMRRVAIVGQGAAAQEVARDIQRYRWHGLHVQGFVPTPEEQASCSQRPQDVMGPCLGSVGDLPRLLEENAIDDIILAHDANSWQTELIDGLARLTTPHGSVLLVPGPFESLIGRMRYRWIYDTPLIEVMRESEWRINWPLKRFMDLVFGSFLMIVSLPILGACALLVRFTSAGPILYRQTRIGRSQQPFTLLKLRTMNHDAEEKTGEILAQRNDPRLTAIGGFLRRFRLDELPQLINVLSGSMSLVGPRPERPGFVAQYLEDVPGYVERFPIAPGLTGLAQVNGHYHSSVQNKLRYDLAYIANWSVWLDLSILVRTVKIVLSSPGT